MPSKISLPELPTRIQKLLEQRQHHTDALAGIDQILAGVGAALTFKPTPTNGAVAAAVPAAIKRKKSRRGHAVFALNAEQSILAFVKQAKNPTTAEINQHLKKEGRSSTADNALSKLVKEKKIKRTPLEGKRGSRYSVL